jgi:hypothetical protein
MDVKIVEQTQKISQIVLNRSDHRVVLAEIENRNETNLSAHLINKGPNINYLASVESK